MNNFVESVRRLLGIAVRLDRTAADVGAARRAEAAALEGVVKKGGVNQRPTTPPPPPPRPQGCSGGKAADLAWMKSRDLDPAEIRAAWRDDGADLLPPGLIQAPRTGRIPAVDGRALGARVDALEEQALWALNRANQMLLRGHWQKAREAVGAADGALAGLVKIEAEAQRITAEGAENAKGGREADGTKEAGTAADR